MFYFICKCSIRVFDKISSLILILDFSLFLSFRRYHIYKQNQNRLNNNNTIRVNLNQQAAPVQPRQENDERGQDRVDGDADEQPSVAVAAEEPQVPFATIFKTFVISFFSSIIPEAPALWRNFVLFVAIYVVVFMVLKLID